MIVVEDAKNYLGTKARVEIIRSLQTEAGRMMFAKIAKTARSSREDENSAARETAGLSRPSARQANDLADGSGRPRKSSNSRETWKSGESNFVRKSRFGREKAMAKRGDFDNSSNYDGRGKVANEGDSRGSFANQSNFHSENLAKNNSQNDSRNNLQNARNTRTNYTRNHGNGGRNLAEDKMVELANRK